MNFLHHPLKNKDSQFTMDGDIAPLNKIVEVAKQYQAYVMINEAYASG